MEQFINAELELQKSVKKGDIESILSLFGVTERLKPMDVLAYAEEGTEIKVALGNLGEVHVNLGADMEKGKKKTIMTLFWFAERSKPIETMRDAEAGESIAVKMYLIDS